MSSKKNCSTLNQKFLVKNKNLFTGYDINKNLNSYICNLNLSNRKHYSTQIINQNKEINTNIAWFLTGFSDGEACFYLSIVKNNKSHTGYYVQLYFQIFLHKKDRQILELFQSKWGVGTIKDKAKNVICYTVTGLNNISVVIEHFLPWISFNNSKVSRFSIIFKSI